MNGIMFFPSNISIDFAFTLLLTLYSNRTADSNQHICRLYEIRCEVAIYLRFDELRHTTQCSQRQNDYPIIL